MISVFGLEHISIVLVLYYTTKQYSVALKNECERLTMHETLQNTRGKVGHRNTHRCSATCCDSAALDTSCTADVKAVSKSSAMSKIKSISSLVRENFCLDFFIPPKIIQSNTQFGSVQSQCVLRAKVESVQSKMRAVLLHGVPIWGQIKRASTKWREIISKYWLLIIHLWLEKS